MQTLVNFDNRAVVSFHQRARKEGGVGVARRGELSRLRDVLRVDHLRLDGLPHVQRAQSLDGGLPVRREVGLGERDFAHFGLRQIFQTRETQAARGRRPDDEPPARVERSSSFHEQPRALKLFDVPDIRRGEKVEGRAVSNLPGEVSRRAETVDHPDARLRREILRQRLESIRQIRGSRDNYLVCAVRALPHLSLPTADQSGAQHDRH